MNEIPKFLLLDLETTGLESRIHSIVEIASRVITPKQILRYDHYVVNPPKDVIWSDYAYQMHQDSGLYDTISDVCCSIETVDNLLAEALEEYAPLYLMGNSVHFDRGFMKVHMPETFKKLHYRQLDITSIRLWHLLMTGEDFVPSSSVKPHRSKEDLESSLIQAKELWVNIHGER